MPRYPKGYKKASVQKFYEEDYPYAAYNDTDKLVPTDSLNKLFNGTLSELKDLARKEEKAIRKEEIFDLQLDMYLFGKGHAINK